MPMTLFGQTANFFVYYDSALPGQGVNVNALGQSVLDYCEYDRQRLSLLFGNILPGAVTINLIPGGGGGSNNLVDTIWCNVGPSTTALYLPDVVVAELGEIFMNLQGRGWIAYYSNGEALSRVLVQILYPDRAWLAATGTSWLNTNPRVDWIDNVEHTDQDYISFGCASLFLNYLAYQLNYRWPDIIGAGAPNTSTVNETATSLGVTNAYQNFSNQMAMQFPPGMNVPVVPSWNDAPFPYGAIPPNGPQLYIRHNLNNDGRLSNSPDIIFRNNEVANPQAAFSTAASLDSYTESDPYIKSGQANYVYVRVWNQGGAANNVFATVYWSPPATLVTPNMWNLIGTAYYPQLPAGNMVEVSVPGVLWPSDQIPTAGHYCFVATVGNAYDPAPTPSSFASFQDFENYIANNNDIAWHNFNVDVVGYSERWGGLHPLPFQITGAWDGLHEFEFEIRAELPKGSHLALQIAKWIGRALRSKPEKWEEFGDSTTDPKHPRRVRIALENKGLHKLGSIALPPNTIAPSHLLVRIPPEAHDRPFDVSIRQLYRGREVGRITWRLIAKDRDRDERYQSGGSGP